MKCDCVQKIKDRLTKEYKKKYGSNVILNFEFPDSRFTEDIESSSEVLGIRMYIKHKFDSREKNTIENRIFSVKYCPFCGKEV